MDSSSFLFLFQEIKKKVLSLLDKRKISSDRANEIVNFLSSNLGYFLGETSFEESIDGLIKKFPELISIKRHFDLKEKELIDNELKTILDKVVIAGDFSLAEKLFSEIAEFETNKLDVVRNLKKLHPNLFD